MSNKKILIIALVFALGASLGVLKYLKALEEQYNEVNLAQVVVAKVDIKPNQEISEAMVEVQQVPVEYIHPQAIRETKDVIGRITADGITKGEEILRSRVIGKDDVGKGLAYVIPKGYRAMSIGINEVTGVSGLVRPGDRVDIVGMLEIPDKRAPKQSENQAPPMVSSSKILVQDLLVLAVGSALEYVEVSGDKDEAEVLVQTLTVAVKPNDAEKLTLVTERGIVRVLLRSKVEDGKAQPAPYTMYEFGQ